MHLWGMVEVWEERQGRLPGASIGGEEQGEGTVMHDGYEATSRRQQWMVLLGLLVALLVMSAAPAYAGRGGHGGGIGGHGGHGFGRGGHGFIRPRLGVSIWPYWDPYWAPYWVPYNAPPVVVTPPPPVYVQPVPPTWYYCDNPQGYYPYVQQCPGGWRPVTPTPP